MAHNVNYAHKNFDSIWDDISPIVKSGDLAFANIEAPVNDAMEWSTYPQFNMHSSYIQAVEDAGFNVFSLANNHTNDWYLEGINATKKYFKSKNNIYACGLKENRGGSLTYQLIEKNDWKILFVAFTEILNRPDYASYIDFYPSKKHDELKNELKEIARQNEHDILVVSIHTDEEEYKTKVTESHRKFFRELIAECGADIIWANHPHVSKEWEKIQVSSDLDSQSAFIMYANGNTISGQRTSPSFLKKHNERDDTGDGLLFRITCVKNSDSKKILQEKTKAQFNFELIEPFFITTYIKDDGQYVVRQVDDDFIHCLDRAGILKWTSYLSERRKIFENLKGISKWQ